MSHDRITKVSDPILFVVPGLARRQRRRRDGKKTAEETLADGGMDVLTALGVPGKDRDYLVPIIPQSNIFVTTLPKSLPLASSYSSSTASSSQTPMPSARSDSLSDAWNPAASTPLWTLSPGIEHSSTVMAAVSSTTPSEIPIWLGNPKFNAARVKLCLRSDRTRLFEMHAVANGVVTVWDGRETVQYPLADLDFLRPEGHTDPVVSFAPGDLFGKIFRVKEFGPVETVVYVFGQRQSKKNTYAVPTSNLAIVYPPFR
ncbi:hypothetical protein CPC08DRAFT_767503 [Agrocybe pediades]|nr:hypothetical protein CPC08DRAFT_767503 [Agrocybe pediades]